MGITAFVARRCLPPACAALIAACAAPVKIDMSSMSFSEQPLIGKVVWNDLVTDDIAAARSFYGSMFGWTFEQSTGPNGRDYVLARLNNAYVAGIVPIDGRADEELSRWLPYVSVADVDAAVTSAKSAGGEVAVPARNVGLGRVAAIIDPEGAVIGVARSKIGDPDDLTTSPAPGKVVWTELLANDPKSAAAFYTAVVGYQTRTIERRGGQYTLLSNRGADRAGMLRNPSPSWAPLWLTSIGVADANAAAARAESLGGKVLVPVSPEVRDGTMAVVSDPSGAVLVLQQLNN